MRSGALTHSGAEEGDVRAQPGTVPKPGTPQARKVLAGILIAGAGGCVIDAMR
jgi:hypothetical protein